MVKFVFSLTVYHNFSCDLFESCGCWTHQRRTDNRAGNSEKEQTVAIAFECSISFIIFGANNLFSFIWKRMFCHRCIFHWFRRKYHFSCRANLINMCHDLLRESWFCNGPKYFLDQWKMFSCPPSINKNKYLENWNSNIWRLWCREQVII